MDASEKLSFHVMEKVIETGCVEYIICPGSRNSAFLKILKEQKNIKVSYHFEERVASFFALGRVRKTGKRVAIVTTSGTAVAEALPAMMEAFYTCTPLLVISADRPKSYRGTGAPQTADQVHLFGVYAPYFLDIEKEEDLPPFFDFKQMPAHLNICLEEPLKKQKIENVPLLSIKNIFPPFKLPLPDFKLLTAFFKKVENPLILVSTLKEEERDGVLLFLQKIQCVTLLEGVSGLRENLLLEPIRLQGEESSLKKGGYLFDGVLKIGGVPTSRIWRDVEEKNILSLSFSETPFSGGSKTKHCQCDLSFLKEYEGSFEKKERGSFIKKEREHYKKIEALLEEYPDSEPSFMRTLSLYIPKEALVYLGNSLPIREWDLFASYEYPHPFTFASRGLNGIDGQLSTFLGLVEADGYHVGIFGDLTTLYDLSSFSLLKSLLSENITFVVVNNGGGKIFSKMFVEKEFQNEHALSFEPLASFWGMEYTKIFSEKELNTSLFRGKRIIEIVPSLEDTKNFWEKVSWL